MSVQKSSKTGTASKASKSSLLETVISLKGYADVAVGCIIVAKPSLLYGSAGTKWAHRVSGFHLSDASTAPGFNHAIGCMVIAVGVGNIVAARGGPSAWRSVFASTFVWGLLSTLTVVLSLVDLPVNFRDLGLGPGGKNEIASATVVLTAINHTLFFSLMWLLDRDGDLASS